MNKDTIPLHKYCPRTWYALDRESIIKQIVNIEDQWNERYTPSPLPEYKKEEIKWTPASIEAFAKNIIKSILP